MAGKKQIIKKMRDKGIPLMTSEEADKSKNAPDVLEEPVGNVPPKSEEWYEDVYSGIDREKPMLPEEEPTEPHARAAYRQRIKQRNETIKRDRAYRDKALLRKRLGIEE